MKLHYFSIQGMNCSHCIMHIRQALEKIEGVKIGDIQIGKAHLCLDDENIIPVIINKIEESGYKVESIQ